VRSSRQGRGHRCEFIQTREGGSFTYIIDGAVLPPSIDRIFYKFPVSAIEEMQIVRGSTALTIGPSIPIGAFNSGSGGQYGVRHYPHQATPAPEEMKVRQPISPTMMSTWRPQRSSPWVRTGKPTASSPWTAGTFTASRDFNINPLFLTITLYGPTFCRNPFFQRNQRGLWDVDPDEEIDSAHPEMANFPVVGIARKILSWECQPVTTRGHPRHEPGLCHNISSGKKKKIWYRKKLTGIYKTACTLKPPSSSRGQRK
jgi:hypothetical protein